VNHLCVWRIDGVLPVVVHFRILSPQAIYSLPHLGGTGDGGGGGSVKLGGGEPWAKR